MTQVKISRSFIANTLLFETTQVSGICIGRMGMHHLSLAILAGPGDHHGLSHQHIRRYLVLQFLPCMTYDIIQVLVAILFSYDEYHAWATQCILRWATRW